ncbi:MAG: ATP-dependent helicase [Actinobacteria bacterium]|nr:MAG: ATP-dependent helicase [Actinomycetota bacterium]
MPAPSSSSSSGSPHPHRGRGRARRHSSAEAPNSPPHSQTRNRRKRRPRNDLASPFRPFTPEQLAARAAAIPVISYPDLPITTRRDDIAQAIADNQVVILAGETGSGKTTQLPKICLQLGRGVSGMIGHTQPRRLAAAAVASRIAEEMGQTVGRNPGQVVGYQVRFTDQVGPTTLVKLMTDGILLAEIQSDPLLRRYDTLIIDEAHERSLNIDFILGYLARLLPLRPDLKVIITSATIDTDRFATHFGRWEDTSGTHVPPGKGRMVSPAPVIEVSGRTFPVEIRYRPLSPDLPTQWSSDSTTPSEEDETNTLSSKHLGVEHLVLEDPDDDLPTLGYGLGDDMDLENAICEAVDELCAEGPGDILVFLPGERDIRDVQATLADHLGPRAFIPGKTPAATQPNSIEILPLFARLTTDEQHRIFQPHSLRRVVLATNIAETSLTVPGIRYVIDPGLARISRYSNRTKVQRLPIEAVSQASANQRAGRCGRVADGVTIRLYSQRDYEQRPHYTEPEILRTSLASVILQMASLGLGSVEDFPFLDAPETRAVRDGIQLLVEIGALETDQRDMRLTPIGHDLARLPIDPRLGRMLLEGNANGCASEVLVIVAALSIQDVRERPAEHQQAADTAHARFTDPHSDFVTYLNLWRYLNVQSRDLSGSALRRMCRSEFLHHLRWREWRDVVNQLRQLAHPLDLDIHPLGMPSPADVAHAASTGGIVDAAARAVVAYTAGTATVDADEIHRSLLVGLLSHLGSWDEVKREYQGARGTHFTIWPGSGLARSHPEWVMTAELVETSRLFARTVARIRPEWIEPLAGDLVKRVYSEPYWSTSKGAAMVKEKVLLYGMTIVAERPVLLGRLDTVFGGEQVRRPSVAKPGSLAGIAQGLHGIDSRFTVRITGTDHLTDAAEGTGDAASSIGEDEAGALAEETTSISAKALAREMLIRHGLVAGRWREHHRFQKRNEELLEQAREAEKRSRTHGLVADEELRFTFFDDLIPDGIISARHFNQWWKKVRRDTPDLLTYTPDFLLPRGTGRQDGDFPDVWECGDVKLPLTYEFSPGSNRDGVTMTIPVEVLGRVTDEGTDWLVPGLFEELITETIRALPKARRRLLAPAPEVGSQVAQWIDGAISGETDASLSASDAADAPSLPVSGKDSPDPMSLSAAMDRLAAWGERTGQARPARSPASASQKRASSSQHTPNTPNTPKPTQHNPAGNNNKAASPRPKLMPLFASAVRAIRGVDLDAHDLDYAREHLPQHLRMTFVVVDQHGTELGSGPSLPYLQNSLASTADAAVRQAVRGAVAEAMEDARRRRRKTSNIGGDSAQTSPTPENLPPSHESFHADNLTVFPDMRLPRSVDSVGAGGLHLRGFPCLVAQGTPSEARAGLRVMATAGDADAHHREGVAHLLLEQLRLSDKRVTTRWTGREALMLSASSYPTTAELVADAQKASLLSLLDELAGPEGPSSVRDSDAFERLVAQARDLHEDRVHEILGHVVRLLEALAETQEVVRDHPQESVRVVVDDVNATTERLTSMGFISRTPLWALPHLARYVKAGAVRVKKASSSPASLKRDCEAMDEVRTVEEALDDARDNARSLPFQLARQARLERAQWMTEELRVSLFAQQLGTPQKVSVRRVLSLLHEER